MFTHQLALVGMFLIEIPLPFGVFWTGLPRVAAAVGFIHKMKRFFSRK